MPTVDDYGPQDEEVIRAKERLARERARRDHERSEDQDAQARTNAFLARARRDFDHITRGMEIDRLRYIYGDIKEGD